MKIFNVYECEEHIYIKLNDDVYLHVGEYYHFKISDNESDDPKDRFTPADKEKGFYVVNESHRNFSRLKKLDGAKINFNSKYEKSVIKKTLDGYDA